MTTVKNIYNTFVNNKNFKHITKFSCVGGLNTTVDFILFCVLNSIFGVNYIISQIVSYSGGTLNSYILNKFWTFNDTKVKKKTLKEVIQFITVNLASLAISLIVLSILMNNSMNSFLAKIISTLLVQIINFLGYKFWVFGRFINSVHTNKTAA
ncbi:GtrA family protein [Clostridium sp.]|jgi:putative flippase GtrA|uniref:GtrA family protein n=1 Tax=Clostridium sp. TaxID=1506 RepID=UPI002FDCC463